MALRVKVREARPEDVERICILWEELMDFHAQYDEAYLRTSKGTDIFKEFLVETIEKEDGLVLVVEDNDQNILAYLLARIEYKLEIYVHAKFGMIYDLSVIQSARRKGLGELMFQASVEWFKKNDTPRIELNVASTNPISTKFWAKQGLQNYYECKYMKLS